MALTVPIEQGAITICLGAADPDATGENQSSRELSSIVPSAAAKRCSSQRAQASASVGQVSPSSVAITTRAASESNR